MNWFPKNPEVTRPIAVCALLIGGAVIAEAVSGPGSPVVEQAVYETKIKLEKPVAETKGGSERSPYFDLDDPEGRRRLKCASRPPVVWRTNTFPSQLASSVSG